MSGMRVALSALRSGARAVVTTLPADTQLADEMAALRLLPGEEIEVLQRLPLGGPLLIRGAGGTYAIGLGLADQVGVQR